MKKKKSQFSNESATTNKRSSTKASRSRTEKLGDYVDYEEVDE